MVAYVPHHAITEACNRNTASYNDRSHVEVFFRSWRTLVRNCFSYEHSSPPTLYDLYPDSLTNTVIHVEESSSGHCELEVG